MASTFNIPRLLLTFCVLNGGIWLDGRADAGKNIRKYEERSMPSIEPCGGTYDAVPGVIYHPATPHTYYKSNEICTWVISSSVPLAFYFSKFNMEAHYDHVSIRDGGATGAPLVDKLSGKSLHRNLTTAGDTHVQFESDSNVVGTGFALHWRVYSAEEQCKDKNGFCVQTGDRCDGTFEMIENSCDDRCACCLPDNQGIGSFRSLSVDTTSSFESHNGMVWLKEGGQCTNMFERSSESMTASDCMTLCYNEIGCNAVNYRHIQVYKCRLFKCPMPVPEPSTASVQWTGYSLITTEFPGMIWERDGGLCTSLYEKSSNSMSASDCMTLCLETTGCNAVNYRNIQVQKCRLFTCPLPVPEPSTASGQWTGYIVRYS